MTTPQPLPANWADGQTFHAADEDAVETAVNAEQTEIVARVPWYGSAGVLPATSGQPLTTQNGNTLDDGFGHVVFNGGTLDGVTIGSATPAASIKSTTVVGPTTSTNWGGSTSKSWLNWQGATFGTTSLLGPQFNTIAFNDSVVCSQTLASVYGLALTHNVASTALGSRTAFYSHITNASTAAITNPLQATYVAVGGRTDCNQNVGGTGTTFATSVGSYWGGWFFAALGASGGNATNQTGIYGVEIDMSIASGSSACTKIGLLVGLAGGDATRGVIDDYGICVARGAGQAAGNPTTTWTYGLMFGTNRLSGGVGGGNWAFASDSTLIGAGIAGPAGNPAYIGIDFSNVTFSGPAIKLPGAAIAMGKGSTPSAITNYGQTYVASDGSLYYLSPGGTNTKLAPA